MGLSKKYKFLVVGGDGEVFEEFETRSEKTPRWR